MAEAIPRSLYVANRFVGQNAFLRATPEKMPLPALAEVKERLPAPWWKGHETAITAYWKAWEIAFSHLRQPPTGSPLIANFIDTAYNNDTFMWDSCFMTMFGRYGHRAFNFQRTLDNFYARQHPDGYICRQITKAEGADVFERFDPGSTGPNLFPWSEWEYYGNFGDKARLAAVFPVLLAYTQWTRRYHTWPDGTYWSTGWGCGMDNLPRVPPEYDSRHENGHMSWIDTTCQQIFANRLLLKMAGELGRSAEVADLRAEADALTAFVNAHLWDETRAFYFDRYGDGSLSNVKTIASFWALLAEVIPPARWEPFIGHLNNPREFLQEHRVPTLSADSPAFDPRGGYWCGSVWAPTNYMVLCGLTKLGQDALAHEIALNHVENVAKVCAQTQTLWENYAPDSAAPGNRAKKDFVGWTGLSPIAILLEYCLGLRADVSRRVLVWDVRLLEEHGVEHYPFGLDGLLNLRCRARANPAEAPAIDASSTVPLTLEVHWGAGTKSMMLG